MLRIEINGKAPVSSEQLHNQNCFHYLRNLKMADIVFERLPPLLRQDISGVLNKQEEEYDAECAYGDIYTQLYAYIENQPEDLYSTLRQALMLDYHALEDYVRTDPAQLLRCSAAIETLGVISRIKSMKLSVADIDPVKNVLALIQLKMAAIKQEISALDDFILSLYDNDNAILESTFARIKQIPLAQDPVSPILEHAIAHHVRDKGMRTNLKSLSPAQAGSIYRRITSVFSANFKPQHGTNLATVRNYRHTKNSSNSYVKEYRFGTQGQRHEGLERVSPLFESFLYVQSLREKPDRIIHIYFNNLGRDRFTVEGLSERALTNTLERLEAKHPNIAVITFPADKGLMEREDYERVAPQYTLKDITQELLQIAMEDPGSKRKIKDFHISKRVREKIFNACDDSMTGHYSQEIEKEILQKLLAKSIEKLGINQDNFLSNAQRQALWFHFVKFELTDYIIQRLKPKSINFACKDAIDRGGVSSAYYNLLKSFAADSAHPMDREEFERALHAAPVMVKARGMNSHLWIVWNAIDVYVNANYMELNQAADKNWLIHWRDANCPHKRVDALLAQRLSQFKMDIITAQQKPHSPKQQRVFAQALLILGEIESQHALGVSGKRLLFTAAAITSALAIDPRRVPSEQILRYQQIAEKLIVKYPALVILTGLMKMFVGFVVALCTLGYQAGIFKSGVATVVAGSEALARRNLQRDMKAYVQLLQSSAVSSEEEAAPFAAL